MHSKSKESECNCNAIKENKINKENKESYTAEKYIPPENLTTTTSLIKIVDSMI